MGGKKMILHTVESRVIMDGSGDIGCKMGWNHGFLVVGIGEIKTSVGAGKPAIKGEVRAMKPELALCFNNEKSIDVVTDWLQKAKELFQEGELQKD
jgi:hypothetical protein